MAQIRWTRVTLSMAVYTSSGRRAVWITAPWFGWLY